MAYLCDVPGGEIISISFAQYICTVYAACHRILCDTVPRTPIADGQHPVIGIFAATGMMVAATMHASLVPVCISPHNVAAGIADLLKKTGTAGLLAVEPVHHSAFLEVPRTAASSYRHFKLQASRLCGLVRNMGVMSRPSPKPPSMDVECNGLHLSVNCPPTRNVSVQPAQNSIRQPASRANVGAPTVADDVCLVFMICNDCTSPRLALGLKVKTVLYYVPMQAPFGNIKVTAAPLPLRVQHFAFWMPTLRDFDLRNCRDEVHPGVAALLAQSSTNYDLAVVNVELRAHLSICHGVNLHGVELAEHDWMCRHPVLPALRLCASAAALHPHSVFVSMWHRERKALSVVVIGCTYLELDRKLREEKEFEEEGFAAKS
ncbi:hypothetical protein B0H14DRAFT_2611306 [Mycena olivaceomarginata]|nr:hypothetical protein B0H14DRAFT_2611306 [Mycena olivaceomarginata]